MGEEQSVVAGDSPNLTIPARTTRREIDGSEQDDGKWSDTENDREVDRVHKSPRVPYSTLMYQLSTLMCHLNAPIIL